MLVITSGDGENMAYTIIIDSCGELTEDMKDSGCYVSIPLFIDVEGKEIIDDDTFDQKAFLKMMAESNECPKSSCPTPESYMEAIKEGGEEVYIITLSSQLSGSYNSAVLGKNLFEEEVGGKKVHVFDSRGASIGQTLIGKFVKACADEKASFEEVVERVEEYIEQQKIFFVLESLDVLKKNGRLTGIKSVIATALNIKPVMSANKEGEIIQLGKARGVNKALSKMVEEVKNATSDTKGKVLGIAHCNCYERALQVKALIENMVEVKEIIITDTAGISSLYASDGGIIVSI